MMQNGIVSRFIKVFLVAVLVGGSAGHLFAQDNKTTASASTKLPGSPQKTIATVKQPDISSDLIVIYFPWSPYIARLIGIGPETLISALEEYQATGNTHLLKGDAFGTTIQAKKQQDTILGLISVKILPSKDEQKKFHEYDSEILVTEKSWNKVIIIDEDGLVSDGFHFVINRENGSSPYRSIQLQETRDFHLYKLTENNFNKLHELVRTLFSLDQLDLPITPVVKH